MLLVLLLSVTAQQDPADLIDRLGSDDIAIRETAEQALKKLGREAVPHLERAAAGADSDLAARAKRLISLITLMQSLTPALLEAMPGVEEKLCRDAHAWTEVFLEATMSDKDQLRHKALRRADWGPLVLRALREARSGDERKRVCSVIANLRIPGAEEQLIELVGSGYGAASALTELRAHRKPGFTSRVIARLSSAEETFEVAHLLVEVRLQRQEVQNLLDHPRDEVRENAVWMAERLGYVTRAMLRKAIQDPSPIVRRRAMYALNDPAAREFIPMLRAELKAGHRETAGVAASMLVDLRCIEALPEILAMKKDALEFGPGIGRDNFDISALALLPPAEAIQRLVPYLSEDDEDRRWSALYTIGLLEPGAAAPVLRPLLASSDDWLSFRAAGRLADLKDAESFEGIARLADAGENVWDYLLKIDRARALTYFRKRVEEARSSRDVEYARHLIRCGGEMPAEAVERLFNHADAAVRREAVKSLGGHGNARCDELIVACLEDPIADVRAAAIEAVGRARSRAAVPTLRKFLAGDSRMAAAQALGRIGAIDARREVESLAVKPPLGTPPWVIAVAAEAGCRLGSLQCAKLLLEFVDQYPAFEFYLRSLNGAREPETWNRLSHIRIVSDGKSLSDTLSLAALQAGLALRFDDVTLHSEIEGLARTDVSSTTVLELLEDIGAYTPLTFILEPGAIRIVPRSLAQDLWMEWRSRSLK